MKKIFLMRIFCLSFFIFFLFLGFFIILPSKIFSATNPAINEFLPHPGSGNKEWVEFYNPDHVDLFSYYLDDDTDFSSDTGNSSKKSLSSINIDNQFYPYIEFSSFLNNSGDFVVLFSSNGEILDKYEYIEDRGQDISTGRSPDGNGDFTILSSATKGSPNSPPAPTSTPIPTIVLTPTKTPTPIRTPTSKPSAISKINHTPTKTPTTTIKTEIPSSRQVALIDEDAEVSTTSPTSILGISTESATPTPFKEKDSDIKILGDVDSKTPLIILIAGVFFGACGILVYFIRRKNNDENI